MPAKKRKARIRKKIPSARSRILKIPDIEKLEMALFRSEPGELRDDTTKRTPYSVSFYKPQEKDTTLIHTHVLKESSKNMQNAFSRSLPSISDIYAFLRHVEFSNIRAWHLISITGSKKEAGRITIRASSKLIRNINALDQELLQVIHDLRMDNKNLTLERFQGVPLGGVLLSKVYLSKLERLGLQVRIQPAKGFKFKDGSFIRKSKKELKKEK